MSKKKKNPVPEKGIRNNDKEEEGFYSDCITLFVTNRCGAFIHGEGVCNDIICK
jgi:hypothetical protein